MAMALRKHRPSEVALPVWTSSDSAAFARASITALAGEGRAAGIAFASVVGVELHMHPDVGACSIGYDELIAVLLLRQQRGHAVQPAPGLWNGRIAPARRCGRRVSARPPKQPPGGRPADYPIRTTAVMRAASAGIAAPTPHELCPEADVGCAWRSLADRSGAVGGWVSWGRGRLAGRVWRSERRRCRRTLRRRA